MGCTKFTDSRGKVIGITCSFIKERGRFLLWYWELHKHTGVHWWINYPIFPWKKFKNRFQTRRIHYSFWEVFKEDVLCGLFQWFEIKDKEVVAHKDNPLWSWFYFQRWYRRKFKK